MLKNDSYRSGTSTTSVCDCGYKYETSEHFLLHCSFYQDIRKDICEQLPDILSMSKDTRNYAISDSLLLQASEYEYISKDRTFSSKIFYLSSWQKSIMTALLFIVLTFVNYTIRLTQWNLL